MTQEYAWQSVPGTLTTQERRHFFGGKMMEIEDEVRISGVTNQDYDSLVKRMFTVGPTLALDQTLAEQQTKAKWEMVVDTPGMLAEYLYHQLAVANLNGPFGNDFAKLNERNVATGKLSDMVVEYVHNNLLNRYQFTKLLLWVKYYELSTIGPLTNNVPAKLLQYAPIYHIDAKELLNTDGSARSAAEVDKTAVALQLAPTQDKKLKATFKQEMDSKFYTFAFYYDLVYTKV